MTKIPNYFVKLLAHPDWVGCPPLCVSYALNNVFQGYVGKQAHVPMMSVFLVPSYDCNVQAWVENGSHQQYQAHLQTKTPKEIGFMALK